MDEKTLRERVQAIDLLLRLLDTVIRDAQASGDDRWKTRPNPDTPSVQEQAVALNAERGALLADLRALLGIPRPDQVIIRARPGQTKAKELSTHGRR